ncbi:sugar efflux transporter [Marinomonas spartinae]|uniref:sugar efflux transporter n=1 Tax=Marinomonas spartinae TaxID=1792290 RepID=UPI0018F1E24A|nr:sugar efflux transporter [Marinomonas spartinae]MBJ7555908.1 sugar efflux transporter [Marinomonas spartinae]
MRTNYWHNWRSGQSATLVSFMTLTFFTGLGSALFIPTLSLFLTNQVHASPFSVGLFYTFNACGGIVFSQLLARYSDRWGHRKRLVLICLIMGATNCLLFDWCRQYLILASLGIVLLSLGAAAIPQTFAIARDYKDRAGERSVMFTSIMRSQMSLAWVIGPAVGFGIVAAYGFTTLFLIGMSIYLIGFVVALVTLPDLPHTPSERKAEHRGIRANFDAFKLFLACTLMWGCNSMYIISMPLYISHQLGLPQELAGWMMGTAAGLEIPIMLLSGYLTQYCRMRTLLIGACLAAMAFYLGMYFVTSEYALLALQFGNAIFIGILGGLGMVYFQDLMPGRSGQATTLSTNAIYTGNVMAGALAGTLAQYFGYSSPFLVAIVLIAVATFILTKVKPL